MLVPSRTPSTRRGGCSGVPTEERDRGEVPADDLWQPGEVGVDGRRRLAGGDRQAGGVQREVPADRRTARLVRAGRCGAGEAGAPREGPAAVTDGPYLETKEYLASFWLLDCASQERAE